jgi:hypothetical protein
MRWRIAEERANNAGAVEEATSPIIWRVQDALCVLNVSEVVWMGQVSACRDPLSSSPLHAQALKRLSWRARRVAWLTCLDCSHPCLFTDDTTCSYSCISQLHVPEQALVNLAI